MTLTVKELNFLILVFVIEDKLRIERICRKIRRRNVMELETIRKIFSKVSFGIEKDGEVFEICELPFMSFPYKSIEYVPEYELYFKGVKIGLFFFPFRKEDPTKKVSEWLIDEIIDWCKDNDLIIQEDNSPIILDGTYWSLGRPAGTFVWYMQRKYGDDIIVRNCDGQILPPPLPDSYYFDAD